METVPSEGNRSVGADVAREDPAQVAGRGGEGPYSASDLEVPGPGDPVLASVGGQDVHASELHTALRLEWPGAVDAALRDRIREILVGREAARLGVTVDRDEVEQRLRELLEDQAKRVAEAVPGDLSFESFVRAQYGMDPRDYRAAVRRKVIATALLERLVRYEALQQDCYEMAVILTRTRSAAEALREKLDQGASFASLARQESVHETAPQGGRLPPLPATFRSPLTEGALGLGPGQVSPVLRIELGSRNLYKILHLIRIIPADAGSWASCRARVLAGLEEQPVDGLEIPAWEQRMSERYRIAPASGSDTGGAG